MVSCRHGDMLGAVTVGNSRSVFSVLSSSLTANELARSEKCSRRLELGIATFSNNNK